MIRPENLPVREGLPDLLRFENGEQVRTPEEWSRRRQEILALYSEYMYGCMPDKTRETLHWSLREDPETGGTLLNIETAVNGRSASFSVLAGLPSRESP